MKRESAGKITGLIRAVIEGICLYPESLRLTDFLDEPRSRLVIIIRPHMADFPIICGSRGRQINAMKFLARLAGEKIGLRVEVSLEESYLGQTEPKRPFVANPDFDYDGTERLIAGWAKACYARPTEPRIECHRHPANFYVEIEAEPTAPNEVAIVMSLYDVMYPYGYRNGMLIKIRPMNLNNSHSNEREVSQGASPLPGEQRNQPAQALPGGPA